MAFEKVYFAVVVVLLVYSNCCIAQTVEENMDLFDVPKTDNENKFSPVDNALIENCDQSGIPTMKSFEIHRLSGTWYELGKTVSGPGEYEDGVWNIRRVDEDNVLAKADFTFSGRHGTPYCLKPIIGQMKASQVNPGEITLKYKSQTTAVTETVRILHTDYESLAVIYNCLYVDDNTGGCNPAGVFASVWTRDQHVDVNVYEKAKELLRRACIDSHSFKVTTFQGPCTNNETSTDDRDEDSEVCSQPLNNGDNCFAIVQRYYYDSKEKKCQDFEFSGCNGNNNNFFTLEECEYRCIESKTQEKTCPLVSPCSLHCPPCCEERYNGCVTCNCGSIIVDKFANCLHPVEKSPNDFRYECPSSCTRREVYAGCFTCECNENTKDDKTSICTEAKQAGHCAEVMPRFFYNSISKECEKFNYTGCDGNNNNFLSYVDCLNTCKNSKQEPIPANVPPDAANGLIAFSYTQLVFIISFVLLYHP